MNKILSKIRKSQSGATAIEYGLIAALIAVILIGSLSSLGNNLGQTFNKVSNQVKASNTSR
jgi:pilus assembly protein Flp/PilA